MSILGFDLGCTAKYNPQPSGIPSALRSGTYSDKGLYLTVYSLSSPCISPMPEAARTNLLTSLLVGLTRHAGPNDAKFLQARHQWARLLTHTKGHLDGTTSLLVSLASHAGPTDATPCRLVASGHSHSHAPRTARKDLLILVGLARYAGPTDTKVLQACRQRARTHPDARIFHHQWQRWATLPPSSSKHPLGALQDHNTHPCTLGPTETRHHYATKGVQTQTW